LQTSLAVLDQIKGIRVSQRSSLYRTVPIGPPQPDYYNACAILHVDLTPAALLRCLLKIETQFGRVRRERWGPRHLDLDLLFYDQLILSTPDLQIPHPRLYERAFVLVPLAEIAADWIDPVSGQAIATLMSQISLAGVEKLASFN
jgi:2-amino-4-hydroxy-6-hydroxymethyldihydropteridine diphosphokinase